MLGDDESFVPGGVGILFSVEGKNPRHLRQTIRDGARRRDGTRCFIEKSPAK